MEQDTPEQIRIFQHRRRAWAWACGAAGVLWAAAWLNPKGDSYRRVAPAAEPLKSRWINPKMNSPKYDDAESAAVFESPVSGGPEQLSML